MTHSASSDLSCDLLLKHIGHEVKSFAFAVAEFRNADNSYFHGPLQDSALVRARTLIDFFANTAGVQPDGKSVHINLFFDDPHIRPGSPENTRQWFDFISGRLSHVGRNRDVTHDQWPDRKPGEPKGDDRLDRLALFILELIRGRIPLVRSDCRPVLETIADRAEQYLRQPSPDLFHAMDPGNIAQDSGRS